MGMDGALLWTILLVLFVCLVISLLWVMVWDSNRFVIPKYTFCSDKLKKDCRFVFLSDLHNKEYGAGNGRLLRAIEEASPDFVLVGGDMLTAKPGSSFQKAVDFLLKCREKYPVYHAIGNHEYRLTLYPEHYHTMYEDYRKSLEGKAQSICFLDNESCILPEYGIRITGLTIGREYYKRFQQREMREGYLKQMIGWADSASYQILLAHNPEYFRDYAEWEPDLVLAGHVHGGVVRIPGFKGLVSPTMFPFPRYDGGLFEEHGGRMIVSRGLGMHTIPVRLFNPGELVVVELRAGSAEKFDADKNTGSIQEKAQAEGGRG